MLSMTMIAVGVTLAHSGLAWDFATPWTTLVGLGLCALNPWVLHTAWWLTHYEPAKGLPDTK